MPASRRSVTYDIEIVKLDQWWRRRPWRARIVRVHVPRANYAAAHVDIAKLHPTPVFYAKSRHEALKKAQARCWKLERSEETQPQASIVKHRPNYQRPEGVRIDGDISREQVDDAMARVPRGKIS